MKRDTKKLAKSSFLSSEKDAETIIRKLFVESRPYSDYLKRLLVINTHDCLDTTNEGYEEIVKNTSVADLIDKQYIKLVPKIKMPEHEEVKSYIIISFDNFTPNNTAAPNFRDCSVIIDVICHTDYWYLGNYQLRPLKIIGYIDGILNESKLSGIGTLNFAGCNEMILDENLSGYELTYRAIHGSDDKIDG